MSDYVVVIPTRNRYRLCLRAIRSALTQTVVPAEVFVVDDASDDPRYQWLEEIVGSPRLTVIRRAVSSREETGAGFAVGTVRNEAIRRVLKVGFVGWMAFLDDDDEWLPTKAAVQFAAVGSNGRYGVLCSNAYNRGPDGVGDQQRGGGGGPALRHADRRAVIAANPHQIIAEGQIGQQLPLAHDGMQVVDGGAGEDRVLGEQVPEG